MSVVEAAPEGVDHPSGPAPAHLVTDAADPVTTDVADPLPTSIGDPLPTNAADAVTTGIADPATAGAADPTPAVHWWQRRRRWGRFSVPPVVAAAVWVVGFAAVAALLASEAARLTSDPGRSILESDSATPVLQAQSILHGHVLLGGWRMLYDSFWTVEVPYYTIGVLITGVSPVLMWVVPAVLATLVLLTAGLLARQGLRGGAATVAVVSVIALIGLPSDVWAVLFLHGAWHVGTMLWCLLAFAGLRSGRWGAGWWVAVVLLAAGLLGDLQTISYGVGAVIGAGILASIRTRRWLTGAPALTAGVAAVVAAYLLRKVFAAWGAYTIGNINAPASHDQRWTNLANIPSWLPRVFGVGTGDWGHNGLPTALAVFRWVAVAVVIVAALLALWSVITGVVVGRPGRTGDQHWRLDDMLLLGCLADLAFYIYASQSNLPGYLRYLAPFVLFGSVLAARTIGRAYARVPAGAVRRAVAGVGAAVTVIFAASFVVTSVQPAQPVTGADLAAFLTQQDLTNGIGTYWPATMTTVASDDRVHIRPITLHDNEIVRYGRQSTRDWYAGQRFQFLVFDSTESWGGINLDSVTAALGKPQTVYAVGKYRVLIWPTTLTIDPDRFAG